MCGQRNKISSTVKNHSNKLLQKESDSSPETKLKLMEGCNQIENSK